MSGKNDGGHTPGPWHINGNSGWSDACKDRGNVFECCLRTGTHIADDQNEVNARLIAAAPDLLAACEAEIARHDREDAVSDDEHDALRTAIAKAKGGAA